MQFDLTAIYRKTQKGLDELAHRTVLGMRERSLLVMVNGKSTVADLLKAAAFMPDPQGIMSKLVEGGFITAAFAGAQATGQFAVPGAVAFIDQPAIREIVEFAERFLDETLGPDADMLAETIEKCKNMTELRTRLERIRDAVDGMGKKKRAAEFWAHVETKLPPA
ncbi:hypothetical protein BURK2_02014 [Burkholderiales bacterium]|nr:MAG: hypothetical protein F9K47_03915 [Burkholderiales bacterium]CAG0984120.1 hypothetical protein BURK2_02014 [Burkholderiales bacterium]